MFSVAHAAHTSFTAPTRTPATGIADDAPLEQRLQAAEALWRGWRRRWWLTGGVAAATFGAQALALVTAPRTSIVLTLAPVVLANTVLGLTLERGWYRAWLVPAGAALDIVLAALVILWFGPGGLVVVLLLAIVPYGFDGARPLVPALVAAAGLAYLGAAALHGVWYGGSGITPAIVLETGVLAVVAYALLRLPAALLARVRQTRLVMTEAEQGFLAVRAPATSADELGFLERSLNRMLDEIGSTISSVQREADEVAAFAEQLAASAEHLRTTSETVTEAARALASELGEQRGVAESSRAESAEAADQADALRSRAALMQADAVRLSTAAERGRERVGRASRTLREVGDEVRTTAASVSDLAGMSERIGSFAQAIARIARQTHLLALNAAIEAVRAEEHGAGFAAVADEVRTLASEAARSAREVAELVSDLHTGIDAAARAMHAGEARVRDVGAVAGEAEEALRELHQGVQVVAEVVNATVDVSRNQAERLAALAAALQDVARISATSASRADGAAVATRTQGVAMTDLTATSQQLAQLAERLRSSIARFSVLRRDQATAEHRAVRPVQ